MIITHEMGVIREICDKVAVLDQGEVVESGSVLKCLLGQRQPLPTILSARSCMMKYRNLSIN